jgi:hypothetical protein
MELYPILKRTTPVCNKYCLNINMSSYQVSTCTDMYLDEDDCIKLLNEYNDNKIQSYKDLLKYKHEYIDQISDYKIDKIKLLSYFDEYGRECSVNVDKRYDFTKPTVIYSKIGFLVFAGESAECSCDLFSYAKVMESEFHVDFLVAEDSVDRYFFTYYLEGAVNLFKKNKKLTFRVNKETLNISCIEDPNFLYGMYVSNI